VRALLFASLLASSAGALLGCRDAGGATVDAGPAALASVELAAARPPPALRSPHPPPPALPDLPALEAHEPPSKLPSGISRSLFEGAPGGGCLGIWNGTEISGTGCARSLLLFGRDGNGAEALVSNQKLAAMAGPLPSVVDHRLERSEGPIRNQGAAPACTAFAMATALDHALARWKGDAPRVSAMQLWSRYHSPFEVKSIESNVGQTLAAEDVWPFDVAQASSLVSCDDGGPKGKCGLAPPAAKIALANGKPIAVFNHVEYLTDTEVPSLEAKLASGQDVIVSIGLPDAFVPKGKAGARYIPNYTVEGKDSGHALVVAGYAALPHGVYFLLHNSWGTAWGDGGYAWMHEATLRAHLREALVLDAEPVDPVVPARPKRQRGETTCPRTDAGPDLVQDSIRGTCSPRCPDGSPRHDGVCAVAGQCPASFVNLTGQCVRAAPTVSASDGGISWRCGPGGCAYVVTAKLDPSCTGATCMLSCPAPDFRLARAADPNRAGGDKLTCIE